MSFEQTHGVAVPGLPTMVAVLSEDLPLKELLLLILGEEGKRKVLLRTKSNQELFKLYKDELALRVCNQRNLWSIPPGAR
jgi:hypothetical protein